eukprot:g5237.t1
MSIANLCSVLDTKHLQLLLSAQGLSITGSRSALEQKLSHEIRRRSSGIWVLEKLPNLPAPRIGCSVVEYDFSFYVFGGFDTMGIPSNSLYVCKPNSKNWQRVQISGTTPAPALNDHVAVVYKDELWVFGSLRGPRLGDREACVAVYNFADGVWRTIERRGVIPQSIERFSVFDHCLREDLLLLATEEGIFGFHFGHEVWMDIYHSHSLNTFWGNYHLTTEGSDLIIFGWSDAGSGIGQENVTQSSLELRMYRLNIDTGSWCRLLYSGTPPSARERCKTVRVDDKWVLHGGSTEYASGSSISDTFIFNLTSKMWIKMDLEGGTGAPRAHYGATSFRDQALVFAGGRVNWLGNNRALSTPCQEVDVLRLLTSADLDKRKEPDTLVVFTDNSRCTMISSLRRQLFKNRHLSDVVIRVEGQRFHAHRIILAEVSPVFAKMWNSEMTENANAVVDVKSFDERTIELLLSYIYGCLDDNQLSSLAVEAFKAADFYEVHGLKVECLKHMISDITNRNVMEYWIFADFYSCEELMTASVHHAVTHITALFNSLSFLEVAHRRPIASYRFLRSVLKAMRNDNFFDPCRQTSWSVDLQMESDRIELLDISSPVVLKIEEVISEIKKINNNLEFVNYVIMNDDGVPFEAAKEIVYENTYITTPDGHGEQSVCRSHKLREVLRSLIKERVVGQPYDPVRGAQISKQLVDDIKGQVKALGYDRYKLVVEATLGQKRGQAMRIASRCLWNTKTDVFATESYEGEDVYCSCQVYAMYYE